MSRHNHAIAGAFGIGLAGAVVGMNVYMMLSPGSQRKMQKSMKKAVSELSEIAEEIGDAIQDLR